MHLDDVGLVVQQELTNPNIILHIKGEKLKDMDMFSKSDPFCILYIREWFVDPWLKYEETEVIKDNLNPEFITPFILSDPFGGRDLSLKFEMYDWDDGQKNDFIGEYEVTLSDLVEVMN